MRAITCWVSCPDPMTKVGDTRWDFRCRRRWITTRSRRPIGIKMLAQTHSLVMAAPGRSLIPNRTSAHSNSIAAIEPEDRIP